LLHGSRATKESFVVKPRMMIIKMHEMLGMNLRDDGMERDSPFYINYAIDR